MAADCMFEILELPEDSLKRVLPKASSRSLIRLVTAYPRTVGRSFLQILTGCVSSATIEFLKEEIQKSQSPSFPQIREAESELIKIIEQEKLGKEAVAV
jgi:hypothetical protein